jgi:hypothetical protein
MEDNDGNIYFTVENWQHGLIVKLDGDGQFLDSVRIENPTGTCNLAELIYINEDYFVVLGHWSSGSEKYIWYVKFDFNLQVIEDKKLDSEGWEVSDFKHIINNKGNIVFVALYTLTGLTLEVCIYEITIDGMIVRNVFFDQPSGFNQAFSLLENTFDYTYKVYTRVPLPTRLLNSFSILDSNFNILSQDYLDDSIYTHNTAKWIDDSTYLITGKRFRFVGDEDEWDAGILKVTRTDSILSTHYFAAEDTVEWPGLFKSLDFISTDNIFYGGSYNTYAYPWQMEPSWIMLNILDSDLNLKAQHYYGGDASYTVNAILATSDSGCVMACSRYDYLTQYNEFDVYILKVNKDGLLVTVPDDPVISQSFIDLYPNPGKDNLYIESKLDGIFIEFINVNAQPQLKLQLESGRNVLNVSQIPAGIYLYRAFDKKNHLIQTGRWLKY